MNLLFWISGAVVVGLLVWTVVSTILAICRFERTRRDLNRKIEAYASAYAAIPTSPKEDNQDQTRRE